MPAQVEWMRDQQQKRLCNSALDKVSDDFRKGVKPHPEVLHEFLDMLNAIDSTVCVNGNRATGNALSARPGLTVEPRSKPSDWRAERPCDEFVVNRACIDHNQGVCLWRHDQEKAAEVRGNPDFLEIAKSRIRAKDLTKKTGQTSSAADNTHGDSETVYMPSTMASNVADRKADAAVARRPLRRARRAHRLTKQTMLTPLTPKHRTVVRRRQSYWRRQGTPGPPCSEFPAAATM